jgi:hypothetical protein
MSRRSAQMLRFADDALAAALMRELALAPSLALLLSALARADGPVHEQDLLCALGSESPPENGLIKVRISQLRAALLKAGIRNAIATSFGKASYELDAGLRTRFRALLAPAAAEARAP